MNPSALIQRPGRDTVFRVDDIDGDVEARERFWAYFMTTRAIIGLAMCLGLAVLPDFGANRVWVATIAAIVTVAANSSFYLVACRNERLTRWLPYAEFATVGALGILAPAVFPTAMVIMTIAVGIWTLAFGPRLGLGLLAVYVPVYGLITLVNEPADGALAWLVFALGGLLATVVNGVVALQIHGVKERYVELAGTMRAIVWERDSPDREMTFANGIVQEMLGVSPAEWKDDDQRLARIHPDDRDPPTFTTSEGNTQREYRFIRPDGSVVWLLETIIPIPSDGFPERRRGIVMDISARKQNLETVRHLSTVMNEVPIPLWVLELDDPTRPGTASLAATNRAADEDPLWGPVRIGGEMVSSLHPPEDHRDESALLLAAIAQVVTTGEPLIAEMSGWPYADGRRRSIRLRVFDVGPRQIGVAAEDISAETDNAEALTHQATHDSLTGLANRTLLRERLSEALSDDPDHAEAALLIMDLNQFKEVNDALGHLHGDRLLIELSKRLRRLTSESMTVARLGGDEFAVVIPGEKATRTAAELANAAIDSFAQPVLIDEVSLQTTVSVGIACAPRDGSDPDSLLQHADIAMYQAKHQGTGYTVFSPDDSVSRMRRLRLTGDLPRAIDRREFVVHYQPKFDLRTGQPTDCEALVRWQHPEFGLLGPMDFIELAEVSGHIPALATMVIESAVDELMSLTDEFGPLGAAVNLSVRNLYDPSLLDTIRRTCDDTGLDPTLMTVEVTESELMDDPGLALQVLLRLRELGLGVSIDDFGTGYSSLAYLRSLPATELKIDRSFVNTLDQDDDIVVRSIIDLGHNLGMRVIAEGVETVHQRELVTALGCDGAQGFLYCRPLPIEDFRRHLRLRSDDNHHDDGDALAGASLGRPQLPFGNIGA